MSQKNNLKERLTLSSLLLSLSIGLILVASFFLSTTDVEAYSVDDVCNICSIHADRLSAGKILVSVAFLMICEECLEFLLTAKLSLLRFACIHRYTYCGC